MFFSNSVHFKAAGVTTVTFNGQEAIFLNFSFVTDILSARLKPIDRATLSIIALSQAGVWGFVEGLP